MTAPRKWSVFTKKYAGGTKYGDYSNKVCIIVAPNKLNFVLSTATFNTLGKPEKVLLLVDNVEKLLGIKSVKENDPAISNAFSVTHGGSHSRPSSPGEHASRFVSGKSIIKELGLNPGVYSSVTIENDILVIDLKTYEPLRFKI